MLEEVIGHRGVMGVLVMTRSGLPVRDSFPEADRARVIQIVLQIPDLVRGSAEIVAAVNAVDKTDDSAFASLRVRTALYELLIFVDAQYVIVVQQDPTAQL